MKQKKLILSLSLLFGIFLINLISASNLSCWFDPAYQESGVRDVWCNFTDGSGNPILDANISHSTYDTNDWYNSGLMSSKGWFIGYQSIPNAYNFSANNYNIHSTKIIDSIKRAHIKYGPFTYPFEHISQDFSMLLKAGSGATTLRVQVCNDTYANNVMGNTPVNLTRTANYNGCQLAGVINATEQGINYNNWTWGSVDVTSAYNNMTENQIGLMDYSIHISSYDETSVNPVGWSITDEWMPPLHNETLEVFSLLEESYNSTNNFFYPDNRTHNNLTAWDTKNVLNVSDTITFDGTTKYPIFDSNDDYMKPLNYSSWENIGETNTSFTTCQFFKRSETGSGRRRMQKWDDASGSGALGFYITGNDIRFWIREEVESGCGYRRVTTLGDVIKDTDWHHVCGVVDRENEELFLVLDGEKVASRSINDHCSLREPTDIVFGRDTEDGGADDGFQGQLGQYMLHNDAHTAEEIFNGINTAWWSLAIGEQLTDNVYATGELINPTTYEWDDEPGHTPIAFTKIYNMNNESAFMIYNTTEKLYHYTYYTNPSQFATSQGASGVNFTTLFEYNSTVNDTDYWHVAGSSNATCEVSIGWFNPSGTHGTTDLTQIDWEISSLIPVNRRVLYRCEDGDIGIGETEIYQEDADETAFVGAGWVNPNWIIDGDWDTLGGISSPLTSHYYYGNYTKPSKLINVKWLVKDSNTTINLTIPDSCKNYFSDKLSFRVDTYWNFTTNHYEILWQCYDGSWNTLRTKGQTPNDPSIYEEAVFWGVGANDYSNCDPYTGNSDILHKYWDNEGTATVVCEVQNDYMDSPYYANATILINNSYHPQANVIQGCQNVQTGFLTFSSLLPTLLLIFLAVIVLGFFIGNMSSGDTQTRFQMNTEGLDSKKIMSMIITIIIVGLLLIVGILIVGSMGGC